MPSGFAGGVARLWPAWGIVAIAAAATAAATIATWREAEADARRDVAFAAQEVEVRVLDRLRAHEMVLRATAGLFDARGEVTRGEWRAFVRRLKAEEQLRGIQGLGFARSLGPGELAATQAAVRAEGFAGFRIWPEGPRERYGAIVYIEPFEGRNLRAFGYDLYSDPVRRAAMSRACDGNEPALTRKVTLVQETDTDVQAGTVLFLPVYRRGLPAASAEERRRALLGWAYSPCRMQDLMRGILGGWDKAEGRGLRLQVFDGEAGAADALLYDSAPGAPEPPEVSLLEQRHALAFAGSAWLLRFLPLDGSLVERGRAYAVLAEGTLLSSLLFSLALVMLRTRERAQALALKLTRDLRESEQRLGLVLRGTNDGFWDWDIPSGRVVFNERWATMLGYELHEIEPHVRTWEKLVHPDDLPGVNACLEAHLRGETPFYECEHRLRTRAGEWKWVLDRGQVVVRDAEGKPLRAAGTHTDVSERRAAAAALQESERRHRQLALELEASERRYRSLFEHLREDVTVYTVVRDEGGRVVDWVLRESNAQGRLRFGDGYSQAVGRRATELFGEEAMRGFIDRSVEILEGRSGSQELFFPPRGRYYLAASYALDPDTVVTTALDITDRRLAEERTRQALQVNEKLVAELREALQKVKTLSGLLPICMYCKKVRDDRGYWEQIEGYISTHTDALFSHGMCPACFQKHRAEWGED